MKLRIKGNSIRLRLNKSEVVVMSTIGYLEAQINFGSNVLVYALQSVQADAISASFINEKITVFVPSVKLIDWPLNDTIGFNETLKLTDGNSLYILLEKDFVCLDETTEDQSDNYKNPHKTC